MKSTYSPFSICSPLLIFTAICSCSAADTPSIRTVAGTGAAELAAGEGTATKVNVSNPFGVEVGPDGQLYITEVGNHRVMRVDLKSGKLTTVAGTGEIGYSGDGGLATAANLNEPYEIRFDKVGNMYFVEMKNHIVRKVDAKSKVISTIAGTGSRGYGGDGGSATKAQLNNPHSIALDNNNNVYIADIGNHRIRRINLSTGIIDTVAGNGKKDLPQAGQVATGRPMIGPRALFVSGSTLWIALREGHSVWTMDLKTSRLSHIAGTGAKGFSGDDGDPLKATFNGPKGIALSPTGNVVVVDTENQAIRQIDLKNNVITTIAGMGPAHRGGKGDGGPATKAQLARPHGICVGPDGTVYIGDTLNHRVRAVR
jgi:streptogramin lyase